MLQCDNISTVTWKRNRHHHHYPMLVLVVLMSFSQVLWARLDFKFKHAQVVPDPLKFKNSDGLKMIHHVANAAAAHHKMDFFEEFDKSADFLKQYGFSVGIIDCSIVKDKDCADPKVDSQVFLYRNDEIWASLHLSNMFDVNSIGSNALQIALLDEVHIINTKVERLEMMAPLQGERNVLFGYFSAIGTYVHRVFMELAYAYNHKVQFMFTTAPRAVTDLERPLYDNSTMIWFFKCKDNPDVKPLGNCPSVLYRGNITLNYLVSALKLMEGPKYFYLPEDAASLPCRAVNCAYLYFSKHNRIEVEKVASSIVDKYQGVIAILLINVDAEQFEDFFLVPQETPSIAILFAGQIDQHTMESSWSDANVQKFIKDTLVYAPDNSDNEIPEEELEQTEENTSYVTTDDEVAEAVYESRHLNIDLSIVRSLTIKTFADIEASPNFTMVLFYYPYDVVGNALLQHLVEWKSYYGSSYPNLTIARLNCYDWTDVCKMQGILHSPTLRLQGKQFGPDGHSPPINYTGALNAKNVMAFLYLHTMENTVHVKEEDMVQLLNGKFRGALNLTSHCLLGLFSEHSQELQEFTRAANELRGTTLFAVLTGAEADTFANKHELTLPSVVALRWNDPLQPISQLSSPITTAAISQFAVSSKLKTFSELKPDLLPYIHRLGYPLAILFWKPESDSEKAFTMVKQLLQSGAAPKDIAFTWLSLSTGSSNDFGVQMLETYFSVPAAPALSMVYFSEHAVYNFVSPRFTEESVLEWIDKLSNHRDNMEPSYRMQHNEWKPLKQNINFLKDHPFEPLEELEPTSQAEFSPSSDDMTFLHEEL